MRNGTAIVTGSGGLIGSHAARSLTASGFKVIGIDNDARASFFGAEASTRPVSKGLRDAFDSFQWLDLDIRDGESIARVFRDHASSLDLVIHAAAQPSHDWAARNPQVDFTINANGTLNLLEATRLHAPHATFAFLSTNKVYGSTPNDLPLVELDTRFELPEGHAWYGGIDTAMSIDRSTHSLFGVSKAASDLLVQEYGRYFGMNTVCFRGGCLTGPSHAGAELHGFLAYLMKCAVVGREYTVFGYRGKQVRDNIHAADVVAAIEAFHGAPRSAAVYNLGGGRHSNCSVLEAIDLCQEITGRDLQRKLDPRARVGDHKWWISDMSPFEQDYPQWSLTYDIEGILREIYESNVEEWSRVPV